MSSGTGPPGPENATPRLDSEAARKVDDDDGEHIVHSQRPDKSDIRRLRRNISSSVGRRRRLSVLFGDLSSSSRN